jgi:UDP-N-acetylglucosamine--N-acetylmuramyl-(pentapeptide) pyrophosphoryl-undecaprenol N-acetylglucosamine transferase
MDAVYSAADIVISRAGALAISEMAIMGKAMILVPFPFAAGDHQLKNAQSITDKGAAKLVLQSRLSDGELESTVIELLDDKEELNTMETKASSFSTPDAVENILNAIMEVAQS